MQQRESEKVVANARHLVSLLVKHLAESQIRAANRLTKKQKRKNKMGWS